MSAPVKKASTPVLGGNFFAQSSLEAISALVVEIATACRDSLGPDESDTIDTLELCLAEAMNNIVEHAYRNEPGHPVEAVLEFPGNGISVTIVDRGAAMPGGRPPETWEGFDPEDMANLPEGGFGWMLIREQMDEVDYSRQDGQNVLRLVIYF